MSTPTLTLVELNEFNPDLLAELASRHSLANIAKVLSWPRTETTTDDTREHSGLDPWVQWVSIHSGVPFSAHGVKRLGDVPALTQPQLWERVGGLGFGTGVWGAMNAARNHAPGCRFFLPDPWTFSERAHPEVLNRFLALPRYYSRNYLQPALWPILRGAVDQLVFHARSPGLAGVARQVPRMLRIAARGGLRNYSLFLLLDLVSAVQFLAYRERFRPDLAIVFLNSVAHLQHHHWTPESISHGPLRQGAEVIDVVLGMMLEAAGRDEQIVVANGLTQRNVTGERPRVLYRPVSPAGFLRATGLSFERVEPLMTNDAHVYFASREGRDRALDALGAPRIGGHPVFDVAPDAADARKLFYQVAFWEALEGSPEIVVNRRRLRFLEHFDPVVARTGAHVPDGVVLSRRDWLPGPMYNHELGNRVVDYFRAGAATRVAA